MKFRNSGPSLDQQDISRAEVIIGRALPEYIVDMYLNSNGGRPGKMVFSKNDLIEIVSDFLPLLPGPASTSVVSTYLDLIKEARLTPLNLLPFAVDPGGNLYLADMDDSNGAVHMYLHDSRVKLRPLGISFNDFWLSLKDGIAE